MTYRITINGREYASPEDMPPEDREAFEALQSLMSASGTADLTRMLEEAKPAVSPANRPQPREWDPRDERGGRGERERRGFSADRILLLALGVLTALALVLVLTWLVVRKT